ncbi:MAG: glycoside hydrolase family 3 protein [Gammaproteobacteria bacterium]|nr:glycoside hydrolase family 3 protein [Gammaproteobacteria bacterium]
MNKAVESKHINFSNQVVEKRIEQLLENMSLAQKIGQMTQAERLFCSPEQARKFHIGSILSGGGSCPGDNQLADWVQMADEYWHASTSKDERHLGIPIIYGVDAIHGNNNVLGATVFPHNIGLGAARNPELMQKLASATAREVLAAGVDWTFAPTLAVAQSNRWGRMYESYSQDPVLVANYAAPFVDGLQSSYDDDGVISCVKHWVGDGGTTKGIDQGETTLSYQDLERVHMLPYYPALEAGAMTVMVSFNSWNGDKCHGHRFLLQQELKGRLAFSGFVVSDFDGIDYLSQDYYEAVALGVNAGIDMFMVPEEWQRFIEYLTQHVEIGSVSMSRIDDAVRRILRVKAASGLLDQVKPSARAWSNHSSFGGEKHRQLAKNAVAQSLVLLKNDNSILPIKKQNRVLVCGKNADNIGHQCGGFTIAWQGVSGNEDIAGGTSILNGLVGFHEQVTYVEQDRVEQIEPNDFDVAVAVIGETPYAEGLGDIRTNENDIVEAGSQIRGLMKVLEPYGTSTKLSELHPEDLRLLRSLSDKNIPIVAVLISGRPLQIDLELDLTDAFVAAWLPGSEGQGVAEVLLGKLDFVGKLPFDWPRDSAENSERGLNARFPIGYGLNYR